MRLLSISAALLALTSVAAASSGPPRPPNLNDIGIDQRLGATLPLDTIFTNGKGEQLPLRRYFGARPVVLALVYYTCPMLCEQILSGMVVGLRPLRLEPGRDFDVVAISINPAETAADAAAARNDYSRRYSRRAGTGGWHFLVGSQSSIQAVTEAAGFHYRYDRASGMFFHASGIMIVTPEGRLSRYFYGVSYPPKDLELGLVEASGNRIGSAADQILLFCYHYDPSVGKYGWAVMNLLRASGAVFFAGMMTVLAVMFRRDARRSRQLSRRRPSA